MLEVLARRDSSVVGTARLRARGADHVAREGRFRMDRWTSRIEMRATDLPPSAILIVRSLRGHVRCDDGVDESRAVASMQTGVNAALAYYATHAVRAAQHVPGDACGAVYFENLSELLACLARDWVHGCASTRWWWRSLMRSTPPDRALAELCVRHAQYVPDVFQRLARSGDAGRVVERLSAREAGRISNAVARTYAIETVMASRDLGNRLLNGPGPRDAVLARLLAIVPESAPVSLPRPHAALLALSLALARVPRFARSAEFPIALHSLTEGRGKRHDEHPAAVHSRPERGSHWPADWTAGGQQIEDAALGKSDVTHASLLPVSTGAHREDPLPGMDPVQTQLQRKAPGSSSLAHVRPPTPDGVLADRPSAGEAFETPESSSEARPFACQTRFGGLFYLLNALLHMNVYGDFTQPRRRAIDLSPWDFLAICGEEWFGARFANDALAPFLARLAGRERGAPIERPRWLRRLLPRIETRIAQALGERRTRRALVRLAVSRARAVDSGTCLDVHFDLARLPLPVRFAGLDRDPGWIPAAARIVAFHFD